MGVVLSVLINSFNHYLQNTNKGAEMNEACMECVISCNVKILYLGRMWCE